MNNLVYPGSAKEKGIHGIVKIRAFVDEYGEVTKDEVVQGIGSGCDEVAENYGVLYAVYSRVKKREAV